MPAPTHPAGIADARRHGFTYPETLEILGFGKYYVHGEVFYCTLFRVRGMSGDPNCLGYFQWRRGYWDWGPSWIYGARGSSADHAAREVDRIFRERLRSP